uniref:Putative secreted protein n=1 Tax=Amblyomma cajennense TaxID=34607 RepID=A0A023FB38_AMBCJ
MLIKPHTSIFLFLSVSLLALGVHLKCFSGFKHWKTKVVEQGCELCHFCWWAVQLEARLPLWMQGCGSCA